MNIEAKPVESGSVELVLESEQEMEALAAKIARNFASIIESGSADSGLVVFLKGNLGSGKTTFARGFLRGFGYQGIVKSPTYTLVEPYTIDGNKMCYHFDLYRLSSSEGVTGEGFAGEELELIGARDYFDGQSICLIEWPERVQTSLPEPDLSCTFKQDAAGRQALFIPNSERGRVLMLQVFSDVLL